MYIYYHSVCSPMFMRHGGSLTNNTQLSLHRKCSSVNEHSQGLSAPSMNTILVAIFCTDIYLTKNIPEVNALKIGTDHI